MKGGVQDIERLAKLVNERLRNQDGIEVRKTKATALNECCQVEEGRNRMK